MTLTELEELEALHAAGSLLAWKAEANEYHADSGAHEVTIDPLASEEECVNLAASINALHNAFPAMAKALREAWEERDQAKAESAAARAELAKARTQASQLRDEREEAIEALENLEGVIRDNIPYYYDQGEADDDEANPEECVEYAAADIAKLKAEAEKLRRLLARLIEEGTQDTHSISSECIRLVEAEIKGYEYTLPEGDRP